MPILKRSSKFHICFRIFLFSLLIVVGIALLVIRWKCSQTSLVEVTVCFSLPVTTKLIPATVLLIILCGSLVNLKAWLMVMLFIFWGSACIISIPRMFFVGGKRRMTAVTLVLWTLPSRMQIIWSEAKKEFETKEAKLIIYFFNTHLQNLFFHPSPHFYLSQLALVH